MKSKSIPIVKIDCIQSGPCQAGEALIFSFHTKAEAWAFIEGVEFVNDSAIKITEYPTWNKATGQWQGTLEDSDSQ